MALTEERMQILKMLEEGKITAEQAAALLSALDAGNQKDQAETRSTPFGMPKRRRVRICVSDGATGKKKVDVNLPIGVVKIASKVGAKFVGNIEGIKLDEIFDAINQEVEGKIIDVQDDGNGERVEIFVD